MAVRVSPRLRPRGPAPVPRPPRDKLCCATRALLVLAALAEVSQSQKRLGGLDAGRNGRFGGV